MLRQEKLIQLVREKCETSPGVSAGMMYGSFTKGEGDQYSDVEFYIFLKNEELKQFDSAQWISDIAPYDLHFFNEYGTEVVVFSDLIRGEFHFLPQSEIGIIRTFKDTGVFPDTEAMLLYDSTGSLKPCLDDLKGDGPNRLTDENVNFACHNFINAWLMGINVLHRGELARSLECLSYVQRYGLRLIRVHERTVDRWLNATKNLERDLSVEGYGKFALITSSVSEAQLREAYSHALDLLDEYVCLLEQDYQLDVTVAFLQKLRAHLDRRL